MGTTIKNALKVIAYWVIGKESCTYKDSDGEHTYTYRLPFWFYFVIFVAIFAASRIF